MALIKCEECGKEISDTAKVCVNCGVKTEIAKLKSKKLKKISIIALVIILVISGIIVIYNNNDLVKSKNKAISLLKKYKNDQIDTPKLVDELEQLLNDVERLYEKEKDLGKSIKLHGLSGDLFLKIEIQDRYLSHRGTSDTKIDEYIKEIKD